MIRLDELEMDYFPIPQHYIFVELCYFIFVKLCYFEYGLKCMQFFWSVKNLFLDECYIFVELYYFECGLKT